MEEDSRIGMLRAKLNEEKIKLWLPPYTTPQGNVGFYPEDMVLRYSQDLGLSVDEVRSLLEQLRLHALENLAARAKFQETGVATLKVKVVGQQDQGGSKRITSISTVQSELSALGKAFKEQVAALTGTPPTGVKIIACGRVLRDDISLAEQSLKHNSQVMALVLSASEAESLQHEQHLMQLQKTRECAELLSSLNTDDPENKYSIQVADQSGKVLNLPVAERKALAMAMTLHEMGRGAMKKRNYGEALVFFLEADNEFKQCTADILNAVDNYALLCLDITWCYLCLQSVSHIPDAEARLTACESCFHRCYGANLERLEAVKGATGNEAALFARLHLLQGIVAFHQSRKEQARTLLNRASEEISSLKVDEEKLLNVVALGYTVPEARLGLRRCHGNVEMAVHHIIQTREEKAEIRRKEKEEQKNKKLQKKLGKTVNGQWINVEFYNRLLSMGYRESLARAAMAQANNNVSLAVQILQDHGSLLDIHDSNQNWMDADITEEMIAQVVSLGYDPEPARQALKITRGNVGKAADLLFESGGIITQNANQDMPSTSGELRSEDSAEKIDEEKQRQAMDCLAENIAAHEEDHLDLDLEEETNFLKEYLALLDSS